MRLYNRGDVSSRYIPKGSRKVADKLSDAVVYLSERNGVVYAIGYCGKRAKHDFNFRFRSEKDRAAHVARYFESRRRSVEFKAEQRAKENKPRILQVGSILRTCWGYEQTNVEFFQVTALIGDKMVELREIAQATKSTGWERWDTAPVPDEFCGEPMRRKVSGYDGTSVKIDDVRRAWLHGVGVAHATGYA